VTAPLTSPNGLILIGITMNVGPCLAPDQCNSVPANMYTSVVYPPNYDWLVSQGGAPAQNVPAASLSTFGASR
jgi:hypothetical protein